MITEGQFWTLALVLGPLVGFVYLAAWRLATGRRVVGEGPLSEKEKGYRSTMITIAALVLSAILFVGGLSSAITQIWIGVATPNSKPGLSAYTAIGIYYAGLALFLAVAPRYSRYAVPIRDLVNRRLTPAVKEVPSGALGPASAEGEDSSVRPP